MTSILKVDQIQNTDGQSALVINSDGSVSGVKYPEAVAPSGRTITSTTMSSYEEGTWVPTNSGCTFTIENAVYTRIGRQVTCIGYITTTSAGSIDQWYGLPFASDFSGTSNTYGGVVFYQNATGDTWTTLMSGTEGFSFRSGAGAVGNIATNKNIRFNIIYNTDD